MENTNSSDKAGKMERYLTDIKELASYAEEASEGVKKPLKSESKKAVSHTAENFRSKLTERPRKSLLGNAEEVEKHKSDLDKPLLGAKDIILSFVNLVSLIILIFLLTKIPQKARELKDLKNKALMAQTQVSLETSDLEKSQKKAEELSKLFIDEAGLVNFVNDIENIRGRTPTIQKVSIASQKAIKDRTGNYGIPVIIEMSGSWEQFAEDIQEIQKLPYLFRTVKVDVQPLKEGGNSFKYGIFLYVKDELGKD